MALFSIGLQLDFCNLRAQRIHLTVDLLYKLLVAPLIVMSVCLVIQQKGIAAQISVFEAAMPVLATAGVVTRFNKLHVCLASIQTEYSNLEYCFNNTVAVMITKNKKYNLPAGHSLLRALLHSKELPGNPIIKDNRTTETSSIYKQQNENY
jgi:hypothetical protein